MTMMTLTVLLVLGTPFAVACWVAAGSRLDAPHRVERDTVSRLTHRTDAVLEIEPVLRVAVAASLAFASERFCRVEMAVHPGMNAGCGAWELDAVLRTALRGAILASRGGKVLIACAAPEGQPVITVTDDGPPDPVMREKQTRDVAASIVACGGTMLVDTRPDRGSRLTLRLPAAAALIPPHRLTADWAGEAA